MRDVPFSMLQLPIWEYLKKEYRIFTGKPLTTLEVALCGSISGYYLLLFNSYIVLFIHFNNYIFIIILFIGGIAAALTTPIDVTKTQIMLANSAVDQNFSTVFKNIYKNKGLNG